MQKIDNNDVIDIKQLFGILLSYKWLILVITFLFCLIAVVYCLIRTPIYTSSVLLKVSSPNQEKIVSSRLILEKVVKKFQLNTQVESTVGSKGQVDLKEYETGRYWQDKTLTLNYTELGQYNLTYNGEILLTGTIGDVEVYQFGSPRQYIRLNVKSIEAEVGSQFSITQYNLTDVVEELQKELKVKQLYKNGDVLSLALSGANREQLILTLNEIANQYLNYEYQIALKTSKEELSYLKDLQSQIEFELHETIEKLTTLTDNVNVNELLSPHTLAQSKKLGEYEADLVKLNTRNKFLTNAPPHEDDAQEMISTDQAINAIQQQIYLLQEELSYTGLTADLIRLVVEREKQSVLNAYILSLLDKEKKSLKLIESKVSILSSANYPHQPDNKPAKLIIVLAIILGLFLSIAFVFIWEYLIKGIKDPKRISLLIKSNLFGLIFKAKVQKVNKAFGEMQTPSNGLESYRQIRENILSVLKGKNHSIITLTGIQKDIGNSYVSQNLAGMFAAAGKRVLFVDSNFKTSIVSSEAEKNTLVDLLRKQSVNDFQVTRTKVNGLEYIPSGLVSENNNELLFSSDLSIVKAIADKYDVVIIDNSPLDQNVNALKLMEIADLNLLTLEYGMHNEDQLSIMMDRLALNNINITGFILNKVSPNDYYGKKYKH